MQSEGDPGARTSSSRWRRESAGQERRAPRGRRRERAPARRAPRGRRRRRAAGRPRVGRGWRRTRRRGRRARASGRATTSAAAPCTAAAAAASASSRRSRRSPPPWARLPRPPPRPPSVSTAALRSAGTSWRQALRLGEDEVGLVGAAAEEGDAGREGHEARGEDAQVGRRASRRRRRRPAAGPRGAAAACSAASQEPAGLAVERPLEEIAVVRRSRCGEVLLRLLRGRRELVERARRGWRRGGRGRAWRCAIAASARWPHTNETRVPPLYLSRPGDHDDADLGRRARVRAAAGLEVEALGLDERGPPARRPRAARGPSARASSARDDRRRGPGAPPRPPRSRARLGGAGLLRA